MRTIEDHKINPANDTLQIAVTDTPGAGGANHRYEVTGMDMSRNASQFTSDEEAAKLVILFQNGPIPQNGVNGITQEVLLAIVADRLRSFQQGPFASRYNALALTHIEDAQNWLNRRTLERMRRGVEGTHKA